tara:strand:+ start:372 stop:641 length:270 start_codon:yes stop_codon:yes gene_type:complete
MSFSKMHCAKNPFKKAGVKHYTVKEYKGKTHKMKDGSLHTGATHTEDSEKLVHGPFNKMVPNCIPKGKLKKESGDPCWKNYVQRGMKKK